jgi:hypothetical protein
VSRTISVFVIFAVLAPTMAMFALTLQTPENKLPACCRRDGKHHCAMMDAAGFSSEREMRALPEQCPFRTQAVTLGHVTSYLPGASAVHYSELTSHPAIHAQVRAAFRISEERTHQKRGPPVLTSA